MTPADNVILGSSTVTKPPVADGLAMSGAARSEGAAQPEGPAQTEGPALSEGPAGSDRQSVVDSASI